jgi:hypothetical protein
MKLKLAVLLMFVIFGAFIIPQGHAIIGGVNVTVTPSSQVAPQLTTATFTVTVSDTYAPGPPDSFTLTVSGLPSGASASFSTNPLPVPSPGSSSTTLTINTGAYSGTFCPGSYPFTVTATDSSFNSGSGSATLVVTQAGPALSVTVSTDKLTYTVGQQVTILLSVTRYAEGTLTISPPSGTPQTFTYQSLQPGSFSKTFSTVNQPVGRWTITFQADDYCSGFSSGAAYFDLSPNTYTISISLSGVPGSVNVNLQVDGQPQGSMTGSSIQTLSFPLDSQHTVAVDQYVPGDQGVRYYSQQNSWTISSGGSHTFNYQTQYYFTVATDPDGITPVSGTGWYNAGTTVQTSPAPQVLNGSSGTQYAFKGWMTDGALQAGNPVSLTLDKPHNAVAKYQTQYQLVVDSPGGLGTPQGSGYYDAGSTAQFSVTSPNGVLIQQVFVEWQGDFSGTSTQGSIVMDKPHIVHAVWTSSYTQLYLAGGALAVVVVVALLLLRRRHGAGEPVMKPAPPGEGESPPSEGTSPPTESGSSQTATPESSVSVTCTTCGAASPPGLAFCTNCGAKLG